MSLPILPFIVFVAMGVTIALAPTPINQFESAATHPAMAQHPPAHPAEEASVSAVKATPIPTPTPEPTPTPAPTPSPTPDPQSAITNSHAELMTAAGIAEADQAYAEWIIQKESGWRHTVWNSEGSGAYGYCQALPASKMVSAGADWESNPVTQLRWCDSYAKERYGGWKDAFLAWGYQGWW